MKLSQINQKRRDYEEQKTKFLSKTQLFFNKRGFSPYLLLDDINRLHIKIKTRRGSLNFSQLKDRIEFSECVKTFAQIEDLEILYQNQLGMTDYSLNEDINTVWDIEIILKGV